MSRCKHPCIKVKYYSQETAREAMLRFPDLERMTVYLCEECSTNEEIWHYGHIRRNGRVAVKKADGSYELVQWKKYYDGPKKHNCFLP